MLKSKDEYDSARLLVNSLHRQIEEVEEGVDVDYQKVTEQIILLEGQIIEYEIRNQSDSGC